MFDTCLRGASLHRRVVPICPGLWDARAASAGKLKLILVAQLRWLAAAGDLPCHGTLADSGLFRPTPPKRRKVAYLTSKTANR